MYITRWHGYQVRMSMNYVNERAGNAVQVYYLHNK